MRHFSVKNTAYVLFEPSEEELERIAREAGFKAGIEKRERSVLISLAPEQRKPMFFDAADQRQALRLAAARTFANGSTGVVFNTPFVLESISGALAGGSNVSVRLPTEIRWDFARRFPHGPSEASLLSLFQQLVQDLSQGMVGLCGMPSTDHTTSQSSG